MGLDMYVRAKHPADENTTDGRGEEIQCWRKNNALHFWMQELYFKRLGKPDYTEEDARAFNCKDIQLFVDDIFQLQRDILQNKMTPSSGVFLGKMEYDKYQQSHDLEFCGKALGYLNSGYEIFYDSWW